ncbi:MAG TPA: hypothetical protein VFK13_12850 [Gemmatimonadaceae bacterium]|nr:hypothetical protein [Gemmatimonadaceae bacterium]
MAERGDAPRTGADDREHAHGDDASDVPALPEVVRSLRSLGEARTRFAEEQTRYFSPLLEARRRAQSAGDAEEMIAAFHAGALATAVRRTLEQLARARGGGDVREERALTVALDEAIAPVHAALAALDDAERAWREVSPPRRAEWWEPWTARVQHLFQVADECWPEVAAVLAAADAMRAQETAHRARGARGRAGGRRGGRAR